MPYITVERTGKPCVLSDMQFEDRFLDEDGQSMPNAIGLTNGYIHYQDDDRFFFVSEDTTFVIKKETAKLILEVLLGDDPTAMISRDNITVVRLEDGNIAVSEHPEIGFIQSRKILTKEMQVGLWKLFGQMYIEK